MRAWSIQGRGVCAWLRACAGAGWCGGHMVPSLGICCAGLLREAAALGWRRCCINDWVMPHASLALPHQVAFRLHGAKLWA